ncbi:MAG: GNAT family N-acetyltransferase [Fimbriimonadaceae bacterium]
MTSDILPLRVRKAKQDDGNAMYVWRNDPATRRYFFDPGPISPETHAHWFAESLESKSRHLLIAESAHGQPIGVIRFDLSALGDLATVDIYLAPEYRNVGLGKPLLGAGLRWLMDYTKVCKVNAAVASDNQSSCRMFMKSGFQISSVVYTLDLKGRDS